MRVVRNSGSTADVVGLGEDLQLRIEIDQDSAFGLFARNLEARTDNGELLNLIDSTGCPLNELIFPALNLEGDTRALNADFKVSFRINFKSLHNQICFQAFRFPSTPTVNFVATVQFCQDVCDPVTCAGELESYGKRRRREASIGTENLNTTQSIETHTTTDMLSKLPDRVCYEHRLNLEACTKFPGPSSQCIKLFSLKLG